MWRTETHLSFPSSWRLSASPDASRWIWRDPECRRWKRRFFPAVQNCPFLHASWPSVPWAASKKCAVISDRLRSIPLYTPQTDACKINMLKDLSEFKPNPQTPPLHTLTCECVSVGDTLPLLFIALHLVKMCPFLKSRVVFCISACRYLQLCDFTVVERVRSCCYAN